jgi:prepilin-type N-terminal cleavage/methylation domain-containing protein
MHRTRPAQRERGFSIIELMVVIAILGIVATLSAPNMIAWVSRMRLNHNVTSFERMISLTKKVAITDRSRYCLSFTGDAAYGDGNNDDYLSGVAVSVETATSSGVWVAMVTPVELAGFTNSGSNDLYKGISLETDPTTSTQFSSNDGCTGLLFNNSGYLDNALTDFAFPCGGANCAKLTLRNKTPSVIEQRTLWIDRGGNVRVTIGPDVPPANADAMEPS